MREGHEERLEQAQIFYEDLQTYMAVGFTREEAMQFMCRAVVNVHQQSQYPPEMHEFWERQNALATKILTEMDDS